MWCATSDLHVIVATKTGSAGGSYQQAFFFVNGRYIGTDSTTPSAGISEAYRTAEFDRAQLRALRTHRPDVLPHGRLSHGEVLLGRYPADPTRRDPTIRDSPTSVDYESQPPVRAAALSTPARPDDGVPRSEYLDAWKANGYPAGR
jgi:hypothetical protein